MGVTRAGECLLELRQDDPTAQDPIHVHPAALNGDDGQQQDARA
jgi:hypothetical protein